VTQLAGSMGSAGAVIRVDKPAGPTSHDIVSRVRRALGIKKVGHTGTLDPFATGLMVVCVGPATRIAEYLTGLSKAYHATLFLGKETSTLDPEGDVVLEDKAWQDVSASALDSAAASFVGPLQQTPPAYSAKKVNGERAYKKARRGEEVVLAPREVVIHSLEVTRFAPPLVEFACVCSSGTYVRVLGRDLARAVGTSGYLTQLRRTAVGELSVEGAVRGDDLAAGCVIPAGAWLDPVDALGGMPRIEIDNSAAERLRMGQQVEWPGAPDGEAVMITAGNGLVAIGRSREGRLKPSKVFPV
jgi:tRNA pseudouridine55 synthase